jgi:hypothetical protein
MNEGMTEILEQELKKYMKNKERDRQNRITKPHEHKH